MPADYDDPVAGAKKFLERTEPLSRIAKRALRKPGSDIELPNLSGEVDPSIARRAATRHVSPSDARPTGMRSNVKLRRELTRGR